MHRRLLFVTVIALLVAALASAISYDRWRLTTPSSKTPPKPTQQDVPTLGAASSSTSTPQLDRAMIALRDVAPFTEPTAMAFRHRDDRLYVAVRAGSINIIDDGVVLPSPLLDLSAEVSLNGERGLLGLAFSPDGEELYASFTDKEGDNRLVAYRMKGARLEPGSRRDLLEVHHPSPDTRTPGIGLRRPL